jgi:hypothetical protein
MTDRDHESRSVEHSPHDVVSLPHGRNIRPANRDWTLPTEGDRPRVAQLANSGQDTRIIGGPFLLRLGQ